MTGGLFGRMFVSFTLAMLVIVVGVAVGTRAITQIDIERETAARQAAVEMIADRLEPALADGDQEALRRILAVANRRLDARVTLRWADAGAEGVPAPEVRQPAPRPPPPRPPGTEGPAPEGLELGVFTSREIASRDATRWVVQARFQRGARISDSARHLRLLQLLFVIVVIAAVCFLLARRLARPLAELRTAANALADGRLDARVGDQVGGGRDEIAALANDFDRMAGRIQALMGQQRQLIRDVSHELRSPLARLQVALGLARQRGGDDLAPELDRIEREARNLERIVGEILTLLETGRPGEADTEPVDLSELVENVVESARFEAGDRVIELRTEPITAPIEVLALRRAVENVLRNALRHAPDGSRVEVSVARDGDHARIRIADRGPGVPEDMLDRMFEPFVRVSDAREHMEGSGGVGLAIVRAALHRHGGEATAGNRDGGGLEVGLRLPLSDDPSAGGA